MPILVALDKKSLRSERIVKFAINEAKLRKEKIHFVHSLFGKDKTKEEEIINGERLLDWALEMAKKSGVECEKHLLVRGKEPAEDIVEFANEIGATMIVIGIRKRSPVGKVLFGSVAQEIILKAEQPVVCIK
ncbi:MAG: universal stress protein [Archaeoglobaceae archaeon]|nr:universal stress protein [Archaeoglobaceae archaeon]MCX8152511.1 universal stress protein [Archaeoglobaceae archaeon]MDW8013611.1 universal stress protein [Archaeoglobaceae archaeon]